MAEGRSTNIEDEDWSGNADPAAGQAENEENATALPPEVVPGYTTFDDYLQVAFDAIRTGIKAGNSLPTGANHNYYSCFPSFITAKSKDTKRVLTAMHRLLNGIGASGNIINRDKEDKFELLLEANDILLDRANACMDVETGVVQNAAVELVVTQTRAQTVNGSWNSVTRQKNADSLENTQSVRLLAAKNVHRPQLSFKDKIDNSAKPWCPRIKEKPNSLKPLAIYMEEGEDGDVFNHPYEFELDKFAPSENMLRKVKPSGYKPLEDTALIVIEKPADVKILLEDLKNYTEIAVDLEHHSYRTFQGITCLLQISTIDTDYLIDTLTLRSELHELNEIFTKPTILKVFHGGDLDIQWLQRDLSLYVVNMFDTHQAARQLNLPYLSLAYLLKKYCNVDPNKHFQLADWRIRPLPDELMKYAREDTHYLLYIKDILKNALIDAANGQTNILKAVYDRSTEICAKTYVKPVWTEESYQTMYRKSHKMFNNKQLYALKELHRWRDVSARQEDDSTGYVLPNHMLLNIAETLPREMQGILACCNPIPPLVRQNLLKLHKMILKARDQPLLKPVLEENIRQRLTQGNQATESDCWRYLPHDIPSGMEARADLPCLLDQDRLREPPLPETVVYHTVTVFDSPPTSEDDAEAASKETDGRKNKFVSPFERYKRVIPMVAEQEAQEHERERKEEQERLDKTKKVEKDAESSKNRVYEHFKQVAQTVPVDDRVSQQKKPKKLPLCQMPGRNRKRKLSENQRNQSQEQKPDNLTTPIPSLDAKIVQGAKGESARTERLREDQSIKKGLAKIQGKVTEGDTIQPMRKRLKGEKKLNQKELIQKGMLPMKKFDYKSVDFSSFQGGSKNAPNTVKFQQKKQKKKEKGRKRNKVKLNI